jgi:hypothetical protein
MKIPEYRYRCPLGRRFPERPEPEAIKRHGWRDQGLLVISPEDDRLNWMEREVLQQVGERLYGRRTVPHG